MLPPGLRTPQEVVLYYDQLYFSLIESGEAHPFIYPWATAGAAVAIIYLLIDHRRSATLRWLRYPVFAFLVAFQGWCIMTNRARNAQAAFGVGLLSCWGTLWVAAIMIVNDCQTDFKRIERSGNDDELDHSKNPMNGSTNGPAKAPSQSSGLRQRQGAASSTARSSEKGPAQRTGKLFWQSYPSSPFIERLDWVADVFCSFRGVGWNWQTSGIPPPPKWAEAELRSGTSPTISVEPVRTSRTGIRRYSDRALLMKDSAVCLVAGYIALDLIKTLMHHDPYFWGTYQPPLFG